MLHKLSYKESDTYSTDVNKHFASPIGNERDTPCIYSQHKARAVMHSQHDRQVVRKNCLRTLKEKTRQVGVVEPVFYISSHCLRI